MQVNGPVQGAGTIHPRGQLNALLALAAFMMIAAVVALMVWVVTLGLSKHVHCCLSNDFRRAFRRSLRASGRTADLSWTVFLLLPPVPQGVQAVHGDHMPLVNALFLLAGRELAVEYVVTNGPGGNAPRFPHDIGIHLSGSSRVVSSVLPPVHAGMPATSP